MLDHSLMTASPVENPNRIFRHHPIRTVGTLDSERAISGVGYCVFEFFGNPRHHGGIVSCQFVSRHFGCASTCRYSVIVWLTGVRAE